MKFWIKDGVFEKSKAVGEMSKIEMFWTCQECFLFFSELIHSSVRISCILVLEYSPYFLKVSNKFLSFQDTTLSLYF